MVLRGRRGLTILRARRTRHPGSGTASARKKEAEELAAISREAAAQTKAEVKAMPARAAKLGTSAYNVAVALLASDLSMDEIIEACKKVPTEESTDIHQARQGAFTFDRRMPERKATKPEEEEWFLRAKADAEAAWNKMFGRPAPQRQLTAEDIALGESFNEIAAKAAGLTRTEDGEKIFRPSRPDEEDARLYQVGEASARRIWPGR